MNRRMIAPSRSTSRILVLVSFIRSWAASQTSDSCTRYRMIRLIRAGMMERPNSQRHDNPSMLITTSEPRLASR